METFSIALKNNSQLPKPIIRCDRRSAAQGVETLFLKISPRIGIKIFYTQKSAEISRKKQLKAWKAGLAPKVLSTVNRCHMKNLIRGIDTYTGDFLTKYENYPKVYGYFYKTQVAKMFKCFYFYNNPSKFETRKDVHNLYRALRKIGLKPMDLHWNNIGTIGRRLVCIDFGEKSVA